MGVQKRPHRSVPWIPAAALFALVVTSSGVAADDTTQTQLDELRQQNRQLQNQLNRQQQLLEELQQKIVNQSNTKTGPAVPEAPETAMPRKTGGVTFGKVNLGMEGGLGFFRSESAGRAQHAEFRVDEARLFIEANVWKDVYVFSEINLTTREDQDFFLQAGE